MKILTLNTWGGRAGKEELLSFLYSQKETVDVFCLQEIWAAPYSHLEGIKAGGKEIDHSKILVYGVQEIAALLGDFAAYFRPHHGDNYGLLMLSRAALPITEEGEVFVYKHKGYLPEGDMGNHARNIQFMKTHANGSPLTIINFHGLWNGKGKTDSEDRVEQSHKILSFIETLEGEVVLCGDFNLLPDTESLKLLERAGLRNLVREHGVTSTRTSHYTKNERFADYIFISSGVKVKQFGVLPDEVSDHAPLVLEIES